jgi:valyl-tRNA synthetase
MIEKNYQPADIETRMSRVWEDAGAFKAGRPERRDAKPFTIVIPPPNVTGSLHMGHALNNTLQDILCRFERMRGRDVLWQPGTDHAGIATQMVVERQLLERQQPGRREMGRAKFLERVWQWKAESGGLIVNQLKRLGASCDWSRERFTMDEGLSRAVIKVFVELHREGLIYKDKRLVNWDPALLTAISDLEVVQTEVKGSLWYLRYPLEGKTFNPEDPSTFIVVATTRPETMLGDSAVAVHPDDERYTKLVGKHVILPLVGRRIPIVADEYSDPEKGSGAVKITPAHDFNDFEVGNRHSLPRISVLDQEGHLALIGNEDYLRGLPEGASLFAEEFNGVERFAARKRILARLEDFGFLERIEPNTHMVPHGDRSGVIIEPYLTDQWYVDAKTMAQPAIAAVRSGVTSFVPKNWEKTYFEWMENIQPWCISRQLWWGHQIPAWYGPDGKVFVAETEAEAVGNALGFYVEQEVITAEQGREMALDPLKRTGFLMRDEDVLDTWFSSALWPFSTLGWPDDDTDVKRYYPTDVLVTGFDIIFFWVARMMMMGIHFMKDVPFPTVYIHALVRDEKGAKMSKSKGNVIDPLHLIDDYGADALRFTLAAMAAQGRDIKLAPQRVEGYRNFATKLWNACRFAEMNGCVLPPGFDATKAEQTLSRWIAHETARATREVTEAIEAYRFNDAAGVIYRFVWNVYCDWYLELAKPVLMGEEGAAKSETRAVVAWARDEILKLLHPFMPFITEELWAVTAKRDGLLVLAPWSRKADALTAEQLALLSTTNLDDPSFPPALFVPDTADFSDPAAEAEIGWVVDLVTAIRSVRAEMNITPATLTPLVLAGASAETKGRAERWNDVIRRMARLGEISFAASAPEGAVQLLVRGEVAALPLKGVIDLSAEKSRLDKELAKAEADIKRVDSKLANEKFVANAPEEIVEEEKEKREGAVARKAKIIEALGRLKSVSEKAELTVVSEPERTASIFVLGAGFSRAAGLPLADDLWREVRRRAEKMDGRAGKFRRDLNDYIEYVADCTGEKLSPDTVNFEKFLSYLDIEFHLGLRGSDTWSTEGNESQVIIKTLIGQILTEKTPKVIPSLYEDFGRKLRPGDTILTFNYDILLERTLDKIGMPYRLFPDRFKEVFEGGGGSTDIDRELSEVLILKLHGSLDWFSKEPYLRLVKEFERQGTTSDPHDPIFSRSSGVRVERLNEGPQHPEDPLNEVYRVVEIESLYKNPPLFLQTPLVVAPSTSKILWFDRFKGFWWGMGGLGSLNRRLTIIGFSLADHDEYVRQIIYAITQNYQKVHWDIEEQGMGKKAPMLIIDFQDTDSKREAFKKRYAFVDWSRAEVSFDGLTARTLDLLS